MGVRIVPGWGMQMRRARTGWPVAIIGGLLLAGCAKLPGERAIPQYAPRVVDREYSVVWKTLLAALRNEGAVVASADQKQGTIQTAYRPRPGTTVRTQGLFYQTDTRNAQVFVRYKIQATALGPEKTEVSLVTEIQYLERASGWVPTTDDGGVAESFWRRFEEDLAYYGMRPETWRSDEPRRAPVPAAPGPEGVSPGREAAGP